MPPFKRSNGVWYVRITYRGRQHWRSLRSRRRPAAGVLAKAEAELWEMTKRRERPPSATTELGELIARYLKHVKTLRSEGQHQRLAHSLRGALKHIPGKRPAEWTVARISDYLQAGMTLTGWAAKKENKKVRRPWKARTAIAERQAISSFLAWCIRRGELGENPVIMVEKPRVPRSLPKAPRPGDVAKLLETCSTSDEERREAGKPAWLDFAVRIALGTGLRLSELRLLEWSDYSPPTKRQPRARIHVRAETSKTFRDRIVPLEPLACDALEGIPKASRQGRILPPRLMRCRDGRYLERASKRLGPRRVNWQTLRQWYCSILAASGVPMPVVQRRAGHSTMQTTERYYVAVADALVMAGPEVDMQAF